MSGSTGVNVYDFDHTIYDGDASRDFILYCILHSLRTWKYVPIQCFATIGYAFRLLNRRQFKQLMFSFLRGLRDPEAYVDAFWKSHEHKVKTWYIAQKHPNDLIISASPEFLLRPLTVRLGLRPPIATIMDICTGHITGKNCRGAEKVKRLRLFDQSLVIESFYSDSMVDAPLLKLARHPYLVQKHTLVALVPENIP